MSNLSIVFRIVRRRNIAKRWESSYAGHIIQKKKKKKLWNCEFFGYEIGKIKEKKKEKGEKKKKKM